MMEDKVRTIEGMAWPASKVRVIRAFLGTASFFTTS
jgi:hypothetical protein